MAETDWTRAIERILPTPGAEDVLRMRTGVVDEVNSDGTVDVEVSGLVIPGLPVVDGVSVEDDDTVMLISFRGSLIVLGRARTAIPPEPFVPTAQVFTSNGTWTKPAGCSRVRVRLLGGGGAGGGIVGAPNPAQAEGGGGGAGGYVEKWYNASALNATEAVVIGAGGTGSSGGNGGAGGNSTFKGLTASGGSGGSAATASTTSALGARGLGGAASGGDINAPGASGSTGMVRSGLSLVQGFGADSQFGRGGAARTSAGAGDAAGGYGAGGGGGYGTSTNQAGGAGAPGICIIEAW